MIHNFTHLSILILELNDNVHDVREGGFHAMIARESCPFFVDRGSCRKL